MENHHFRWVNQLHMAIFNRYVSLPEGNLRDSEAQNGKNVRANWGPDV